MEALFHARLLGKEVGALQIKQMQQVEGAGKRRKVTLHQRSLQGNNREVKKWERVDLHCSVFGKKKERLCPAVLCFSNLRLSSSTAYKGVSVLCVLQVDHCTQVIQHREPCDQW